MNPITTLYQLITRQGKTKPSLLKRSLGQSYLFFLTYYALLAIILTAYFSYTTLPQINQLINQVTQDIQTHYPTELVIEIKDNTLTTNLPQPIEIPHSPTPLTPEFTHLAIINTDTYPKSITELNTLMLATQNAFGVILDPTTSESRVIQYSQLGQDLTITHRSLTEFIDQNLRLWQIVYPYFPAILFITILIALHISRLIFLLIYTLATQAIGQLLKRNHGYTAYFKVGLHTIIPAEIIYQLQLLVYPQTPTLIFALTFLIITTLVTFSLKKQPKT